MTTSTDSSALRDRLVTGLVAAGVLRSPQWVSAFRAVPREMFVDRFVAVDASRGRLAEHDLAGADPDSALRVVYCDTSLLTQWDAGGTATSSSTAPSLMALMLEHLDARPGHRVLEVGTGTGYNAALICHALGADAVTTMDIHPHLVEQAADRLGQLGYRPRVVIGDGRDGFRRHAAYDRIIATCGFDRVPAAWRPQVVSGGVVVVNVGFGLAVLHAVRDGLSGRFVDQAAFMAARTDTTDTAYTAADALTLVRATSPNGRQRASVWPGYLDPSTATIAFLRSLLLPGVTYVGRNVANEAPRVILVDPVSESWAVATAAGNGKAVLTESGPRQLWDELIMLFAEWNDLARPAPDQYGLTVRWDGTHVLWLHEPDRTVRVLPAVLPAAEQSEHES